ncbi:MAG: TIGR02757 family protein [Elusimicrobia bacterium]|nr:TIGR02757 family protein [Elusimicrobiota bacterium]
MSRKHLALERIYRRYNRRKFVHPDPLEFSYDYPDIKDREIIQLIASSLAYGRVEQILKSVSRIVGALSGRPRKFLLSAKPAKLYGICKNFRHRFTDGEEMFEFLTGIKKIVKKHGSLEKCFLSHFSPSHETTIPAQLGFARELRQASGSINTLIPDPGKKSAFKRLNLFLRWAVRHDVVDPGGWSKIAPSKLIVPLDVHLHRIARMAGFTRRNQADMKTALEITRVFRKFSPDDPVKYDFCLTRFGIRDKMNTKRLKLALCGIISCNKRGGDNET